MKKRFFLLFLFIFVAFIDCFIYSYGLGWTPDGRDYIEDTQEVIEKSANNTLQTGLYGDGGFNSLTSGVGDQYYGFHGTNTGSWDAYIPDSYAYGDVDILINPAFYSERDIFTGQIITPAVSHLYFLPGTVDYHNDFRIQPNSWTLNPNYIISPVWHGTPDAFSQSTGFACSVYDTTYGLVLSRFTDGSWATNDRAIGSRAYGRVCYVGYHSLTWSNVVLNSKINIDCDPDWVLKDYTIRVGLLDLNIDSAWWGLASGYEASVRFERWDSSISAWRTVLSRFETATSGGAVVEVHPTEVGFTQISQQQVGGTRYHLVEYKETVNKRLRNCVSSWDGVNPRFDFILRANSWTGWVGLASVAETEITECTIEYTLEWDGTYGDFAKDTTFANKILKAGPSGNYNYPDLNTGEITYADSGDFSDRMTSDFYVLSDGDSNYKSLSVNYDISRNFWTSGATVNDVVLQFSPDGSTWITLTPQLGYWFLSTPSLKSENWYVAGDGIKFRFKGASYATGLNGFAFSYAINYDDVSFVKNSNTISFSGTKTFSAISGRFIDEYWDEVRFNNSCYIKNSQLGVTPLTLTYNFDYLDDLDGFPRYSIYDDTTISIDWYGPDVESVDLFWNTDNDAPTITDYKTIPIGIEGKPILVNVTGTDLTSNVSEGWLFGAGPMVSFQDYEVLTPTGNGAYQDWDNDDYTYIVSDDGSFSTAVRIDGILYDDSYKNSSYLFSDITASNVYNVTNLNISLLTRVYNTLFTTEHNLSVNVRIGSDYLGIQNISFTEQVFFQWNTLTWSGLNYTDDELDDLEVIVKTNEMVWDGDQLFVDMISCSVLYNKTDFQFVDAIKLNNTFVNGPQTSFYDYVLAPVAGNFTYWYMIRDSSGNWATTLYHNISVEAGAVLIDLIRLDSYELGPIGNRLVFNISDTSPDTYEVWIDEVLEYSGSWSSPQDQINVSVDGYSLGYHNISIYANNSLGRERYYNTTFVVYLKPIIIFQPVDYQLLGECTGNITYNWLLSDDNPDTYELYRNNTLVSSGDWDSLITINYNVDSCAIGQDITYIYKIYIKDEHGVIIYDETQLDVFPVFPIISDEIGGGIYEDWELNVSWIVGDDCLVNYTVEYYDTLLLGWVEYHYGELDYTKGYWQNVSFILDADDFPVLTGETTANYTFRCTVYDWNGNSNFDYINVTVLINPPIISDVEDGYYFSDDLEAKLVWNVKDNNLFSYIIVLNTTVGYIKIQEGSLLGLTESTIILDLYKSEFDVGSHEIIVFVVDTYGNIVNDTVIAENRGERAGIELNVQGIVTWVITIFVGIIGLFALTRTGLWERWKAVRKTQVTGGVIALLAGILIVISLFGYFPVTFVKLPEVLAGIQTTLGTYGVLLLVLGIVGGVIGGIFLIRWLLSKRKE